MKPAKKLYLLIFFLIISVSCILPDRVYMLFSPFINLFPDLAQLLPEKDGGDDSLEMNKNWTCSAANLQSYLGDKWQAYQTLDLDMFTRTSREDTLMFYIDFWTESKYVVKRDPDSWAPPGATQVPEGEYEVVEHFLGYGEVILIDSLYLGSTNVDYTIATYFPEPVFNNGKIGYRTIGRFVSDSVVEICLDVYEGGYEDAVNQPFNYLAPNCRWPGYIFTCTPAP